MLMFTFWWLSTFSFHRKWNEAWLLLIKWYKQVASGVAEQLKTYSLNKLGNIATILKFCRIIALPSAHSSSRNENFVSISKILLKNRNWTFPIVRNLTWKLELVSNIMRTIAEIIKHARELIISSGKIMSILSSSRETSIF